MESLKFILFAGVLSATFSWLIIPLIINRVAPIFKIRSAGLRDVHEGNIPRLGGIGVLFGLLATIICFEWIPLEDRGVEWPSINENSVQVLYLGSVAAWSLGLLDDVFNLKPRWKIIAQLTLGFVIVLSGFRIQFIDLPFTGMNTDLGYLSWPVTILWIVGVMNAFNLIDGLDGLAGGVVITSAGIFALISFFNGEIAITLLLVIVMGATFGFWLFNRSPAVIFMGDSGSYLLGYIMSILSLWATENERGSQTLAPLLVLAFPLIDTFLSLFRRYLKGIPFYSADRDHLHHRLINKGFSHDQITWFMIGITIVFGTMGGIIIFFPKLQGFALLGAVVLSYLILYWMEYDVVRKPFSSAMEHLELRKKRNLMVALADGIDDYFSKDPDLDSILRSFCYWMKLADVSRMELYKKSSKVWNQGTIDNEHHMILFCQNEWGVRLALSKIKSTIDSDVKHELLERVSIALINRIKKLDS